MNKRANLYLNIFAFITFILSVSIIGISLKLETLIYHIPFIIRGIVALIGMIIGIVFISIELFLFILMKNKERLLYIGYILLELLIAILITTKIPYSFFIVLVTLNITRDIIRVSLVDKIYRPKEFNRYCKMFGIKIKDFPKKRKVSITNKRTINIPVNATSYNKKTKTTKKTASATSM